VNGEYQGTNTIFLGCYLAQPWLTLSLIPPGGYRGGGGQAPPPQAPAPSPSKGTNGSNTTVCAGPAKFTGVTQTQAPATGAFFDVAGIRGHQFGGVAVKPSLYGQSMPGPGPANQAALYAMAPWVPITTIIPQDTSGPKYGGPAPPYQVTDIISPRDVRNAPGQQFDVYDFPTKQDARQATIPSVNTFIVVQDPNYTCPAGFVRY
jgi:hypothetical protein